MGEEDNMVAAEEPEAANAVDQSTSSTAPAGDPTTLEAEEDGPERTKLQMAVIMVALCMAVFLSAIDQTIITTALPVISEHFQSSAGYTWIGAAYLLGCAATMPSWGKLSDIWGRKPVLLTATGVFFIGSLLGGASISIAMLIVGRAIQGMGGGGCMILVNICISDMFSMRNRATYFGFVGMAWAIASSIGPVLGGVFTQKASWRWCFYINLPASGAAMTMIAFFLHLYTPKTPLVDGLKAIDWFGSMAVIGGVVMFLVGLQLGGVILPWNSAGVICLVVFGLVTLAAFLAIEWKIPEYPVIPLRIFKHWSNIAALVVCFCHGMAFIAAAYYLPLYFQAVLGKDPLTSGILLLPYALTLSFGSGIVGVFIRKTGRYLEPIWFGMTLLTLGVGLLIDLPPTPGWPRIILYQIVAGTGAGPNFQAPLIALQSMISPRDIATATSTFGFVRSIGTSIAVVIGGVVFQNGMQSQIAGLRVGLGDKTAALLSGSTAGANVGIVNSLPHAQKIIAREAFRLALRKMWILFACVSAFGMAMSLFIVKQTLSKENLQVKTGLPQHNKDNEKDRGQNVVPAGSGGVMDKV